MKTAYLMLLAILIATPVFAQGMFTDVPSDHWAYDAVDKLQQDGIIIGYPDGTFGGKRSLTRYEFAVAIARLMDALPASTGNGGVTKEEVSKMLEGYVKGPLPESQDISKKADKADVDAIKKLVDEFRDEIAALGVDVDAMKRDVAALGARVDALEKEVNRVRFSGDVTIFARASHTSDGDPVDLDGRSLNEDMITDIEIVRDMDLKVTGRVAENVTANALINYGNYLNWLGQVDDFSGDSWYPTANGSSSDTFFPYYLYIDAGIGSNAALTVGRFPLQFTPYTLKMIDVDSYTNILKTSDGNYPVDGVKLAINLFGIDWTWFAVKNDGNNYLTNGLTGQPNSGPYVDGGVFHQGTSGNAVGGLDEVTQTAGVRFSVGIPWNGVLGGTFYQAWNKYTESRWDQARVYGADLSMPLPFLRGVNFNASWTQSDTLDSVGSNDVDYLNEALDGKLSFTVGSLDIGAGYKDIGRNFAAAGAWDKIGEWQNPTNVKGPYAEFAVPFGESVKFCLNGEWLKVKDPVGYWAKDDKVIKAEGMLKWMLNDKCSLNASYEWVRFDPDAAGESSLDFKYLTLGYGHQFSPNAKLSIGYQMIDTEDIDEVVFKNKGGLGVVQFGVSF